MKMKSIYLVLALGLYLNMVVADSAHTNLGMKEGLVRKMLRQSNNQTSSPEETLNLPANATSIRENITDTFRLKHYDNIFESLVGRTCENRTYGYYADVDNDCQIFHVCQPMNRNTSKSHNSTRRYSFICPKQTIFDQATLVCARPIDAVDCEDAPNYYDKNLEFGQVNNTMEQNNTRRHMPNHYNKNDIKKRNIDLKTIVFDPIKSIEEADHKNSMARDAKKEIKAIDGFEDVLDKSSRDKGEEFTIHDTKINRRSSRNRKERKFNRSLHVKNN